MHNTNDAVRQGAVPATKQTSSHNTNGTVQHGTTPAAQQTTPVTVLLTHHQVALMDEIAAAIRRNTGVAISRSALLRAIATPTLPCFEDWLHCTSVGDVQKHIARRLRTGKTVQS